MYCHAMMLIVESIYDIYYNTTLFHSCIMELAYKHCCLYFVPDTM